VKINTPPELTTDRLHCLHFEYCDISPFVKGIPDDVVKISVWDVVARGIVPQAKVSPERLRKTIP
jgi:hypothetical protein